MEQKIEAEKCVLVVDEALPAGILANTAAILGITLGHLIPHCVGPDIIDGSGQVHRGIVTLPLPVLKAGPEKLKELRHRLFSADFSDVTVVDFSDVAQNCHVYGEYTQRAMVTPAENFGYLGLLLYGQKKKINQLTGSLPLLK